jgi:hypothetical protein
MPGNAVLSGWVVGTAGAERNALPDGAQSGHDALEHGYGYLLGTVDVDGNIAFAFRNLDKADLLRLRGKDFTEATVNFCWEKNPPLEAMHAKPVDSDYCN